MGSQNENLIRARTMEAWARAQHSDCDRQTKIARFILSLSRLASDLNEMQIHLFMAHGVTRDPQSMSLSSSKTKEYADYVEKTIREHAIDTFGEDIFLPGDPASIGTLPSEGSEFG